MSHGDAARALVIGYGSIGRRHAEVLTQIGCAVAVVSRRAIEAPLAFRTLEAALHGHRPGYVVIANETGQHETTLAALAAAGFQGTVLVEKPLFGAAAALPAHDFGAAFVAYNLRFHPVIGRLKALLTDATIISCAAYVGQYLPDWRPQADYRQSYSASAAQGGGVLRDLSHELDYLCWILGGWRSVAALGGHFSALEIDSDDVFALLLATPRCPVVSVQLNYLDRSAKRRIVVNTNDGTLEADLVAGTVTVNGATEHVVTERNTTYLAMHRAILAGQRDTACSLAEGLSTLHLIDSAVQAARTQQWIHQ